MEQYSAGYPGYEVLIENAVRAFGPMVEVEPGDFLKILSRIEKPIVIKGRCSIMSHKIRYLTSWQGLYFTARCDELQLPANAVLIHARKIWLPNL